MARHPPLAQDRHHERIRPGFLAVPNRPCIIPGCPRLTPRTRCPQHQRAHDQQRNADPRRDIYRDGWQGTSRKAREAQPWCSLCGDRDDLSLDHTTGWVVCRRCHRPDAHGGVRRRSRAP